MRVLARIILSAALLLAAAYPALADKRLALVIGNGNYKHAGTLANPRNDASDVQAALKVFGFKVILGLDLDRKEMDAKIREFARALSDADTAVLFYAGHGLQVAGQNYLIPIDAKLESERDLEFEAVRVEMIMRQLELEREAKTSIVFLDACRNNPLSRNLARSMGTRGASVGQGLAQIDAGVGSFIAFSTQPGNVALDGSGRNSPFAAALTKRMKEGGRNLNTLMIEVRKDVLAATGGKQVPWDHSALTGDFYFDAKAATGPAESKPAGHETGGEAKALNARIEKLESELKKRDDAEATATLARLKDESKRIETQNFEDWQRIFELRRNAMQQADAGRRREMETEATNLQMKISRRSVDSRRLSEEIAAMEAKNAASKPDAPAH